MIRKKSLTHLIMESQNRRRKLDDCAKKYLIHLDEGHEGELEKDDIMEATLTGGILLKNQSLSTPNGDCQIDTMLIKGGWCILYDCKNYPGEHIYRPESLLRPPDFEIDNPEDQMHKHVNRVKSLFRKNGINLKVVGKVVYINPSMTMFNAPEKSQFLMRSQLVKHLEDVNELPDYPNHQHEKALRVLKENKAEEIRFKQIPPYTFDDLEKGVYCKKCDSLRIELERNVGRCKQCGVVHKIADMLQSNIEEFVLMFPNEKLKNNKLVEWCGGEFNRYRIYRAINQYNEMLQTQDKNG